MTQRSIGLSFDGLNSDQARIILDAYDRAMGSSTSAQVQVQATETPAPLVPAASAVPAAVAQFPSAPVASVPHVPQAPAAQPPAATEKDAFGVPYNADLHATRDGESGGKLQNGRWKMKRHANRAQYDAWHGQFASQGTQGQAPAPAPAFPQQQNGGGFPQAPESQPQGFPQAPESQPQGFPSAPVAAPQGFPQAPVQAFAQPQQDANPWLAAPTPQPRVITEDEFMAKAQQLHAAGRLPPAVAAKVIADAGATDNLDLIKTESKRLIGWAKLIEIENSLLVAA